MIPSARELTLRLAHPVGATVHLRARPDPLPGLVTGLVVRPGVLTYLVAWGDASESGHYDFELRPDDDEGEDGQ